MKANLAILALTTLSALSLALSPNERRAVLGLHNRFRSQLALGKAANSDGRNLPPGKNIAQLKYDRALERLAQEWASLCTQEHSTPERRKGTGENLFFSSQSLEGRGPNYTKTKALKQATNWFWAELRQHGLPRDLLFETSLSRIKKVGHMTQMAWAKTSRLGCGIAHCPEMEWKTYVVCRYSPAGNFLKQPIYLQGSPCSGCGPRAKCNQKRGLCILE